MIGKWISGIVGMAVISVLVEALLPSGNLKKHVRFVTGMMLILAVLEPFANIL